MGSLTKFITVFCHSQFSDLTLLLILSPIIPTLTVLPNVDTGNISQFFVLIPTNPCITALKGNESKMLIFLQKKYVGISTNDQKSFFHSATPREGETANWIPQVNGGFLRRIGAILKPWIWLSPRRANIVIFCSNSNRSMHWGTNRSRATIGYFMYLLVLDRPGISRQSGRQGAQAHL